MEVMDIKNIEQLLDSFYEGITSIEEEKVLLNFFEGSDVPQYMRNDQQLFLDLYHSEKKNVPENLENKLNNLIDNLDKQTNIKTQKSKRLSINWKWVSGIAASIAIFVSAGIFFQKSFDKKADFVVQDTYTDPKEAYLETQKAMLLVSNKLNKGLEQVGTVQNNVDKVNKIMNKNNIQL